jgi:phosphoribosyl 1,2-cyclic phosphate phosphodiesterase
MTSLSDVERMILGPVDEKCPPSHIITQSSTGCKASPKRIVFSERGSTLSKPFLDTEIQGRMILLGTGTSVGVPMIGCGCQVCTSPDPHNHRTRCSAILGLPRGNLLIDTPPDLRHQLLRERIGHVDAVVFTHEHADHVHGLDDLRLFPFRLGHAVPLYCEARVRERIYRAFDYAFADVEPTHPGSAPKLQPILISEDPFEALGVTIIPIRLQHGPRFTVLGFRFGNVAYCTDVSAIPAESMERLRGLDTLVLGTLRYAPHPTHLCIPQALEIVQQLQPRVTYLTHTSHELDYEATNRSLPHNVRLAYDGMQIELD